MTLKNINNLLKAASGERNHQSYSSTRENSGFILQKLFILHLLESVFGVSTLLQFITLIKVLFANTFNYVYKRNILII